MSSEHFIKYLKNPKLLNEVTYESLSQMREKYPYSHILHYLLFLKSQQSPADLAEHKKNASIFAVDNNKLFEEIKEFQELEQKPTDKHTMDDLFDLSDDEENKEPYATENKVTPSNDSEETTERTQPRIIREQRYIPLDPALYNKVNPEDKVVPTPPVSEPKTPVSKQNKIEPEDANSNVFFIDALINLDNTDRIELITNKDAYKEVTDAPIYYEPEEIDAHVSSSPIVEETIEDHSIQESPDEKTPVENNEIHLEITNDQPIAKSDDVYVPIAVSDDVVEDVVEDVVPDVVPDSLVGNEITDQEESFVIVNEVEKVIETNEVIEIVETDESIVETKKSFDKWVRKKEAESEKKKSSKKKKKKKKKKMPLNARESLKETDIIASETLAELLVKQGRNKKAIKVYERLCLIFPQKSNYFAQIIKNLK